MEYNNCHICQDELDESKVFLQCSGKHGYHYKCIYKWYQTTVGGQYGSAHPNKRECPYCRTPGGYLPLNKEFTYHPEIHGRQAKPKPKKKVTSKDLKKVVKHVAVKYGISDSVYKGIKLNGGGCAATTKNGNPCKNGKNPQYGNYCGVHKKLSNLFQS